MAGSHSVRGDLSTGPFPARRCVGCVRHWNDSVSLQCEVALEVLSRRTLFHNAVSDFKSPGVFTWNVGVPEGPCRVDGALLVADACEEVLGRCSGRNVGPLFLSLV